jgi:outer membrane protein OmpA-like peptidoglycan-associated protein
VLLASGCSAVSRWSDGARVAVPVLVVALAPWPAAANATSSPEPSSSDSSGTVSPGESERPMHVWVPEPLGEPARFPTLDLEVRSIDLVVVSQDLEGTSTTESSNDELDVTLDSSVLFGKDSAELRPGAREKLAEVARQLEDRGPGEVRVVGHTDDLGSAAHGYDLSRRRAASVRSVLAPDLSGYDISTVGKGEDEPRVPNTSEANRALNRRVEIHYTATDD